MSIKQKALELNEFLNTEMEAFNFCLHGDFHDSLHSKFITKKN